MNQQKFITKFKDEEYPTWYVKSPDLFFEVVEKLNGYPANYVFGIDLETQNLPEYKRYPWAALSPHMSNIRLVQIFTGKSIAVIDLNYVGRDSKEVQELLFKFLTTHKFIAHYAVFELMFLTKWGSEFLGEYPFLDIGCSMLMAKMVFHAARSTDVGLKAGLEPLVDSLLGVGILKKVQNSKWGTPELTFEQVEYAALDAVCTLKVAEKLLRGIKKYDLTKYYMLCKAAQHPVVEMQLNGMGLDVDRHRKMCEKWGKALYVEKQALLKLTGLDKVTPHKLSKYLESTLDDETLVYWPKTDKGKLKTDAHTFAEYGYLDIVKPISRYSKLDKLTSSFGGSLIRQCNPHTGRLHANYNLCGARTGRMSCSAPNLQQLPRDADVRKNFVPRKGWKFVVADLSQIELRVMAEITRDKDMLNAYRKGLDIHTLTASKVTGKAMEDVTKEERALGKQLGLGLLYGLGGKKFGQYARKGGVKNITDEEGKAAVKAFRAAYPGLYEWQKKTTREAAKNLYSKTITGKLRRLDPDNFYGASLNTPVQGSAAEIILFSLVRTQKELHNRGLQAKLCNCVHDETIIECPAEEVDEVKLILEQAMTDGFLDVFPKGITRGIAEASSGINWGDAKK